MDTGELNMNVASRDFKYYIFDWDDNILHMPTKIYLEKKGDDGVWRRHSVSTAAFAVVRSDSERYRPPENDWKNAFVDFQDYEGEGESRFLSDTRIALERVLSGKEQPGPSFETLRETLREGRLFAIVTARGHDSESLKQAVRLFIDMVLSPEERKMMLASLRGYRAVYDHFTEHDSDDAQIDYYLSLNRFHAVTNPAFCRWMRAHTGSENPGSGKNFAIRDFIEHVVRIMKNTDDPGSGRPISVGFSDDDLGNVEAVSKYIKDELSRRFPSIKFCVYDTSDPALADGKKVTISGQMDFGF